MSLQPSSRSHRASALLIPVVCWMLVGCGDQEPLPRVGTASLIDLGGKSLTVPPPVDMIRCDEIWKPWDDDLASTLPVDSRVVAAYCTHSDRRRIEQALLPFLDRNCVLQIASEHEEENIGFAAFDDIQDAIEDDIEVVSLAIAKQAAWQASLCRADDVLPEAEPPPFDPGDPLGLLHQEDGRVEIEIEEGPPPEQEFVPLEEPQDSENPEKEPGGDPGETEAAYEPTVTKVQMLGHFADTKTSLGTTVSAEIVVEDVAEPVIAAVVLAPVNGRVLSFVAISSHGGDEDRLWVERTARIWSRLARNANPEFAGTGVVYWGTWLVVGAVALIALLKGGYMLFSRVKAMGTLNPYHLDRQKNRDGKGKSSSASSKASREARKAK